ncbi:MAG: vWA domain-containing protein [Anaerolineae bacterium]
MTVSIPKLGPALAALSTAFLLVSSVSLLAGMTARTPALSAATLAEPPSSCRDHDPTTGSLLSAREVAPAKIRDCETATVSVTLRATCVNAPLHVMIDLDRSRSMAGQPCVDVKEAAYDLLDVLDMPNNPSTLVGLVTHGDRGETALALSSSPSLVRRAIGRVSCGNVLDNLADSVERSATELAKGRSPTGPNPVDVMIVLSDGGQAHPTAEALPPADRAKADGIIIVSVCVENREFRSSCDVMQRLASSPGYYFEARQSAEFSRVFHDIGNKFRHLQLQDLTVAETLPQGLRLVPGSARPPADVDPTGSTLTWHPDVANTDAITYTYDVTPTRLGDYTVADVSADYHDSTGRLGHIRVPTDTLSVWERCVTPSATPTNTVAPSRTPTASATPTATPTTTPTSAPRPLYLPVLLRERCTPDMQRADVALVIDASTSMMEQTSSGRTKLAAAIEAAGIFLDQLELDAGDQAAIVAFNADAELLQPLVADRGALDVALAEIEPALQTCLVCGVDVGADELASARREPGNTQVMIVLTDGLSNPRPASEAVARAAEAKRAGVVIYTIGLGYTRDFAALEQMASASGGFFRAPDAEVLSDIYEQIAVEIPCPAESFWGGR